MLRFLLIFTVVIALLLHNLPFLVRDQMVSWLLNNGAEKAQLTAIRVDWLKGRVSIEGLKASAKERPTLEVDKFSIDLDYSQLTDKKVVLTDVELTGINLGIREQEKSLWLGPLDLNALTQTEKAPEKEFEDQPLNWSFGVTQLRLSDIDWQADVAGQKHHLQVKAGLLADVYLWDQEQLISIDLDGILNGAPIALSSSSRPLPEEKSSELKIKLDNFPLHSVAAVFVPTLRAYVDVDLSIKARSHMGSHKTTVSQNGSINVRNLSFEQGDLKVKEQSLAWKGAVDLALLGRELKSLDSNGQLVLKGLDINQTGSQVVLGGLKLNAAIQMQGLKQIKVSDLVLDASKLNLSQATQTVNAETLHLSGSVETKDMQVWQAAVPAMTLADIDLSAAGDLLVSIKGLNLTSAALQHTDKISLAALAIDQLKVEGDGGVFTQWSDIRAQDIALDQLKTLSINKLLLSNSKTRVHLTPKRNLSDLEWLLARLSPAEGEASAKGQADSGDKPFRVKLDRVLLSGNNQINVVDQGVTPAFKTQLDISKIDLRKLDTGSKGETRFDLTAKSKFSKISAKGAMELFSGNYGGHWDAEIKGLELPEVSPYSLEYTGYYLQSGQLSLTTKGTIKDRKLDGDSDIRLNKLEVEARNSERSGEFDQKVSMPLGTAIMILQDNDNNIDLQIPLDGSLDDPQFGYQTVINKLAGKGLKNAAVGYLTKALQPFGALISISQMVMDAQEKGSFIKLQPVIFTPAQAVLSAESKQYMAKLAQMMNERKGMRMNICGLVVGVDEPAIWQQLIEENKKRKKPLDEALLRLELMPALQALAQKRSDVVKGELSDKQGVDIERLFSCYPKVDLKSKEEPRVTLGL